MYPENRKNKIKRFLNKLKDNKRCKDCKRKFRYYILDYDHREAKEKKFNLGRVPTGVTMKELLIEIKKCDLVCANCHRERTHKRRNKIDKKSKK